MNDVAVPRTVFEAFGHNELCDQWVYAIDGQHLDETRACTCGARELAPADADKLLARFVDAEKAQPGSTRRDGMAKIRKKGGAKEYKRGAGRTGRERLAHRLFRLQRSLERFARVAPEGSPDRAWAEAVAHDLLLVVQTRASG